MPESQNWSRTATCTCGRAALETRGAPIVTAGCYCADCRAAAARLEKLPAAPRTAEEDGSTEYLLVRKDRVQCTRGQSELREHRLTPESKTRRVVAACCNTPLFLEFRNGHWLSIYRRRFEPSDRPRLQIRTMTRDRVDGPALDDDVPSYRTHSVRFMWKLLAAWVAMGFRAPAIDYVSGDLDRSAG